MRKSTAVLWHRIFANGVPKQLACDAVATGVLLALTWAYWPLGWQATADQYLAVAACFAPLTARRLAPVAVLLAGIAAAVSLALWPLVYLAWWLVLRRRLLLAMSLVILPIILSLYGVVRNTDSLASFVEPRPIGPVVLAAAAALLGAWMRERAQGQKLLLERIDLVEESHARREKDIRAGERIQLAREMHDVVAHRLSVISLHSAVLARRAGADSEMRERLTLLERESVLGVEELGEVLSALRSPDAEVGLEPNELSVRDLVDEAADTGQDVALTDEFRSDSHSSSQLLSIKRVLREGLTNARKYSSSPSVSVNVVTSDSETRIELRNTFSAQSIRDGSGTGLGLVGLEERVRMVGGSITAETRKGHYILVASIPCGVDTSSRTR